VCEGAVYPMYWSANPMTHRRMGEAGTKRSTCLYALGGAATRVKCPDGLSDLAHFGLGLVRLVTLGRKPGVPPALSGPDARRPQRGYRGNEWT